jgi:hypothetical protein
VTGVVVFHGQLDHRLDVSGKMTRRATYRRARRFRIRHRQPRFSNRTRLDKLAPSLRQRKEVIVRFVKDSRRERARRW